MFKLAPFKLDHALALDLQPAQQLNIPDHAAEREVWRTLEDKPGNWTLLEGGQPIACAGLVELWRGRAGAWAMLSRQVRGPQLLAIHRQVQKGLEESPFRRVETSVDLAFAPGHRWAWMLGFRPEGIMQGYDPAGRDHMLYARLAHG